MQRHAVHGRRHAVLAHSVVDEAPAIVGGREDLDPLRPGIVGAGEIARAADHLGGGRHQHVERILGGDAAGDLLWRGGELLLCGAHRGRDLFLRQFAAVAPLELGAQLGRQRGEASQPRLARSLSALPGRPPGGAHIGRYLERRKIPAQPRAGALDLLGSQRRAVALLGPGLGRRTESDDGAAGNHGWPVAAFGGLDRRRDRVGIVPVDPRCRPAGRLEAFHLVDRIGERERSVDRDAVVVVQHDELVQPQMPGERNRLLADAFHQVAVGAEHEGGMVDQVGAEFGGQMPFGDRHADRGGEPLAERSGRRLDAGGVAVFRMAGCQRAELAEALDLLDRHPLIAEQMQQRVEQHRAVPGREHEAVTIGPSRIGRIEFQEPPEQHGGDIGRPHGQAGVPALRLLHRIHGKRPDGVGHALVLRGVAACGGCGGGRSSG